MCLPVASRTGSEARQCMPFSQAVTVCELQGGGSGSIGLRGAQKISTDVSYWMNSPPCTCACLRPQPPPLLIRHPQGHQLLGQVTPAPGPCAAL